MDKAERLRLGDEYRAAKVDLMISLGISDRKLAEIMFDIGRAYGLSEAADMIKEPCGPPPSL